MPTRLPTIEDRLAWLMEVKRQHTAEFCSPEAHLARLCHLAEHPTYIIALKCMDGRIHLPSATNTPRGVIHPIRNLGGMFDIGWPYLGEVLHEAVQRAVHAGRRVLILINYHFSKSDKYRGCAGHNYDTEAAIAYSYDLKRQVEEVFGHAHQTVYPMVFGFETDDNALIFHGENGDRLDVAQLADGDRDILIPRIEALYPDMPEAMVNDLLPLIEGNIQQIAERRTTERNLNIEHGEWIICVGRGFDFFQIPNIALIIGPYNPDLSVPITKAAGIIHSNMQAGRIPDDGFLLLGSAPYYEVGVDRARAVMRARFLTHFASDVIRREIPSLASKMVKKTMVLNWNTRALEEIES
jgi:hypothetical protein